MPPLASRASSPLDPLLSWLHAGEGAAAAQGGGPSLGSLSLRSRAAVGRQTAVLAGAELDSLALPLALLGRVGGRERGRESGQQEGSDWRSWVTMQHRVRHSPSEMGGGGRDRNTVEEWIYYSTHLLCCQLCCLRSSPLLSSPLLSSPLLSFGLVSSPPLSYSHRWLGIR